MSRKPHPSKASRLDDTKGMKETRDSIMDVYGARTPYFGEDSWPERVDERWEDGPEPERWVQSACVLCSNGCACDIGVRDGKIVGVRGRGVDRVNRGRLGPKGLHGWVANQSRDRLTTPLIRRGDGLLHPATWDEAMELVVDRFRKTIGKYTPGAIGVYNTGQLFIEEYYTLALTMHGGIGTRNMDGNTRLCTATSAMALKESFGSDGQPGSYSDIDVADCFFLVGHNMAATQTVLWSRVLDRRYGPKRPKLVVVDPRKSPTAAEADVHLEPRIGTNVALLNGLINLIIENERCDREFIEAHTVGYEKLRSVVAHYPPERVEEITGVPAATLRQAADILGSSEALVSTALQGVYQSNQATAAAVQINNINLIRGMIGKPGASVLQMNGQPTAQNTRETGCDGEFPVFFNHQNAQHMAQLANHWNIEPERFPHWTTPPHIMEMMHMIEVGSIKAFWIVSTNPVVSLPELHRVRAALAKDDLFLVVQDAFLTETAQLASVVLPAAMWGEKTGTFTNADRTVHISHKAVDPPGEARSDFDIFIDFARRMELKDKHGERLIKWSTPEGAFEHFKDLTRGRLCDYSGLSYAKLSEGSGIQWPCNSEHPQGTTRLYTDRAFPSRGDICQSYGHDLETGGAIEPQEYRADDPNGRAILKAAHYQPSPEEPDKTYPFRFSSGRVIYQFHTRTKTGRSKDLHEAAPEGFVEMARVDAERLGISDGEVVFVASRRGHVEAPVRIGDITPGNVFMPFHYGYWDASTNHHRAANELTLTVWDPVSKQPYFKTAAVQIVKKGIMQDTAAKVSDASAALKDRVLTKATETLAKAHIARSRVSDYLALLTKANEQFIEAGREISRRYPTDLEIRDGLKTLSQYSQAFMSALVAFSKKYGHRAETEPDKLRQALIPALRTGDYGLLRDLHGLFLLYSEIHVTLAIVGVTAQELRDLELHRLCDEFGADNLKQQRWLLTQIKHRGPHALTVPL